MATVDQIPPEQLAALEKENQGPLVIALVLSFTAISFTSVCLRFFSRIAFVRNVGPEDYIIAASMCASITMGVSQVYQAKWGGGRHQMFVSMHDMQNSLKFLFISILSYCVSLALTRTSILIQYWRIFLFKSMRIRIYIVMAICLAFTATSIITGILSCIPVDAFWNLEKKSTAKCFDVNALFYANASINVVVDLLIASLPVKGIWNLRLPRRQKFALLAILTIGWFVCIVSVLRLHALIGLGTHPEDSTWYGAAAAYWSAIEVNLSIVCASAPALKPLVGKIIPHFTSSQESFPMSSFRSTRVSRMRKSIAELKPAKEKTPTSSDIEHGQKNDSSTVLSYPGTMTGSACNIYVSQDIEQYSEPISRKSESSQADLVAPFAEPTIEHSRV